MALTQIKSDGIANGAVTTQQIAAGAAGGPKITQIQITNSGGTVLDDTAVSTSGGYIKITGTGFSAGAQVIINNTPATSTTFTSTTVLNAQVGPAVAGTYVVYVVNTDGGVAIAVNGLTYSAEPIWVTGSTLPNGTTGSAINIQLSATDATSYVLQEGSSLPDGLTLTSGGLLSGTVTIGAETTYSFTVIAIDNELQDSPRTFSITITVGDPYFYLTTLLLPGNGTNNQNNNVFLDSSNNNFTITRNGNTTQGTFSPFSQTGWSNYFDGSGDYLSFPGSSAFNITTNTTPFTIEFWSYPIAAGGVVFSEIFTPVSDQVVPIAIIMAPSSSSTDTNGKYITFGGYNGSAWTVAAGSNTELNLNTWTHVACVFTGSTTKIFFNGVDVTAANPSTTWPVTGQNGSTWYIAKRWDETATPYYTGYISNFRFVKGTAVYTSAFTPPTAPLTAIANTSLLTCQSNRFIDNSTNNFTITRVGNTNVQSFSPFNPTSAWSAGNVGGSAYFDGNGDYLRSNLNSVNIRTAHTIEAFCYITTLTNFSLFSGSQIAGVAGGQYYFNEFGASLYLGDGSIDNIVIAGSLLPLNQWFHIAITFDGTTYRVFINGTLTGSSTTLLSNFTLAGIDIGGRLSGVTIYSTGYISNFRLVKGTAVYTNNFTPPTTPLTNIANTSLLLNFTNAGITDATSKNILETIGDAKISTIQSKWGGSSMFFDGSGDWLVLQRSILYDFGTGDFTIEGWANVSSIDATYRCIFSIGYPVQIYSRSGTIEIGLDSDDSGAPYLVSATGPSNSITANTWFHFAVVRNGTTVRAYVNGISGTAVTGVTAAVAYSATAPYIGTWGPSPALYPFTGYINDLRITKGYARYTANFTPPTSAFQTQ